MPQYRMIQTPTKIDSNYLYQVMETVKRFPNETVIINFKNTKEFSLNDIRRIEAVSNGRVQIRIEGGYDQHRINSYPADTYLNMHKYDNIYTTHEVKKILAEIEKIERGINPNWSTEQKLLYFIGTIKNKVIYHPFHETAASKDVRSLRGLFSHNTVCAGYAVILKELCDRNGIECQYVEGATKKEIHDKGYLNHAWNIVKINGNYFPLDLTWNAGASSRGKTLSISDIANVNHFIREHIPGRYEAIQDYTKELKSIDGRYLASANNLINKDMLYELSNLYINKNGRRVIVSQVEEFVVDNKSVYKYVCAKQDDKGNIGKSHIFYSTTNVLQIVRGCADKRKLEKELESAKRKGDTKRIDEIESYLRRNAHLEEANNLVDDLLFSDVNLSASSRRGDNFIGEIKVDFKPDGTSYVDGVIVDPTFAKKLEKTQRRMTRSDKTSFVIEDMGNLDIGGNKSVYRYKMFEYVKVENKWIVKKNTIFTDQNLMNDDRQLLIDDFLARDRIDRKAKETSGYLGFYSKNNVRTYDPTSNEYFSKGLYERYRMNERCVKEYVPELTMDVMKRMVQLYDYEVINGRKEVVNRRTRVPVTNPIVKLHAEFSLVWLKIAGLRTSDKDIIAGDSFAFEFPGCKSLFEKVSNMIISNIQKTGNIDQIEIYEYMTTVYSKHDDVKEIMKRMFEDEYTLQVINRYFRETNPSSIREKEVIQPIFKDGFSLRGIEERRRMLEEEKQQLMEVIERNGQVELVPARKR